MKLLRQYEVNADNEDIMVGDQMVVKLDGFGEYIATAQRVTDDGMIFMFDDCITVRQMNNEYTNDGGYEKSELHEWINGDLLNSFPEDIKNKVTSISIPTYGQIFGHDDWYERKLTPDIDEQFALMRIRKNRVADYNNEYEFYWLQNSTQECVSSSAFARVHGSGNAYYGSASGSVGVRPVFVLNV